MKKSLKIGIICILLVASLGYAAYYYFSQSTEVEVTKIEPKTFKNIIEKDGKVVSMNDELVATMVTQKVDQLFVKEGDYLKAGDLILQINDTDFKNQLNMLMIQKEDILSNKSVSNSIHDASLENQKILMNTAEETMNVAKDHFHKSKSLYDEGAVSKAALDTAKQNYNQSYDNFLQQQTLYYSLLTQDKSLDSNNSALESINEQIAMVTQSIEDCTVKAEKEGVLINFDVKKGQIVSPNFPLGKIVDVNHYAIEAYLLADETFKLNIGDQVNILHDFSGEEKSYVGEIAYIASVAEEKISSLGLIEQRVKVLVKPEEGIDNVKIGSSMDCEFTVEQEEAVYIVPKTAIFATENNKFVFVDVNGKVEKRMVTLGKSSNNQVIVLEGLEEGNIVINNYKTGGLSEGTKITYTH